MIDDFTTDEGNCFEEALGGGAGSCDEATLLARGG
jgi:hypothetical protein